MGASATALIITGPSASGKNAVASALATRLGRCAVIDVDVVRYLAVQPHKLPAAVASGLDPNEELDWRIGVRASCGLARSFLEGGFHVVILDVLTSDSLALYRSELAPRSPKVVLLLPSFEEVLRRHRERGPEPPGSFMRAQSLAEGFWRLSEGDLEWL